MAVTTGDIIRVAARFEWGGTDDIVNTFHFEVFTPPTGGNIVAFMEDVSEHLGAAYTGIESIMNSAASPADISIYNVTQDAPYGIVGWPPGFDGPSGSGDGLPPQDACLLLFRTAVKRRVGRCYLSPINEGGQNNGQWSVSVLGDVAAFGSALIESVDLANGSDIRLVVYSRSAGERSTPTSWGPRPLVARMGSRKPGRGS